MSSWWTSTRESVVRPGRLIWTYAPHVDQHPFVIVPEGRTDPEDHASADYRFETFKIKSPPPAARLPVAGLPHFQDEVRLIYRAKRRPMLVLSGSGSLVDPALRVGAPRYQTNPTILAAPYYSCESRWNTEFVERIKRCSYSQYMFDVLPIPGGRESILRLNHVQPIGAHSEAYELTEFILSAPALDVVEQQFRWFRRGILEKAELFEIRNTLLEDT